MLAPPRYSCRSGPASSALFPPWSWAWIHHTCPTDADIGWFDLEILLSRLAQAQSRSRADTPSPGLFRIVEWEHHRVECLFDHEIEVLSSSWRRLDGCFVGRCDRTGPHTRQRCPVRKEEGFIAILSTMYNFLSNQKQFRH